MARFGGEGSTNGTLYGSRDYKSECAKAPRVYDYVVVKTDRGEMHETYYWLLWPSVTEITHVNGRSTKHIEYMPGSFALVGFGLIGFLLCLAAVNGKMTRARKAWTWQLAEHPYSSEERILVRCGVAFVVCGILSGLFHMLLMALFAADLPFT